MLSSEERTCNSLKIVYITIFWSLKLLLVSVLVYMYAQVCVSVTEG